MKFEEMFEIGELIYYHNTICSVESFEFINKNFSFLRGGYCYVLKPLLGRKHLLDREELHLYEEDVNIFSFGDMVITNPSKVTEEQLIEEMVKNLDTIEIIGETTCNFDDDGVYLFKDDDGVYLSPQEALELKKKLDKYVGEKL